MKARYAAALALVPCYLKATIILSLLCLVLNACRSHTGAPTGVYVQQDTGHVFNALKFDPSGEVDISDVHASILRSTYKNEGDHVTIYLGQQPIELKFTAGGCLDGGPKVGLFCSSPRIPN